MLKFIIAILNFQYTETLVDKVHYQKITHEEKKKKKGEHKHLKVSIFC